MAMPTYEDIMLPFMLRLADGQVHSLKELHKVLADDMKLSDEDRNTMLPSGKQYKFYSRIGWARTYLKKALVIESVSAGHFKITHRGQTVLNQQPLRIDNKFLAQFPEFLVFRDSSQSANAITKEEASDEASESEKTPRELMDACYQELRAALADELLQQIADQTPAFFEQLVLDLLLKMGYGGSREDAAQVVGKTGDEGIDGIIKEDRLGLDVIYVQAKRWKNAVGSPEIQGFIGALQLKGAHKGIFITTSYFTQAAYDVASRVGNRVVLMDGSKLTHLMIEYGVGVSSETVYDVKRIDMDYFEGE
ncbi:restriction endonuclease [Sporomusa sp. KB1]|jgi:restriction system protein|uniref:restriction endonuclease n=1 Tax=Sporomusa sp. KB1 TaxID=943346 RepID=UPI0011AAA87A|nr:restriction endonuclease [Sporomusa sp. KB1]TWH49265.1 restriction system protein [Sporomusa sp. KB1]